MATLFRDLRCHFGDEAFLIVQFLRIGNSTSTGFSISVLTHVTFHFQPLTLNLIFSPKLRKVLTYAINRRLTKIGNALHTRTLSL